MAVFLSVLPCIAWDDTFATLCPAIGWDGVLRTFWLCCLEPQYSWSSLPEKLGLQMFSKILTSHVFLLIEIFIEIIRVPCSCKEHYREIPCTVPPCRILYTSKQ
jgi:hypothetical protein